MLYIVVGILFFWLGWKLGRKYQDFTDIMLARRVAKLVSQREQVAKDHGDYEKWVRQDRRLANVKSQGEGMEDE